MEMPPTALCRSAMKALRGIVVVVAGVGQLQGERETEIIWWGEAEGKSGLA
jgi:hypothetical protein